jgi:hypothetical protein
VRLESPPLSITFLLAATVAWGGIALAVVSGSREQPPLAQFAKLTQPPAFDERWDETTAEQPLRKSDRLAVKAESEPQPVKTDKAALANVEKPVTKKLRPQRERNVCTRHGMRKVKIRGGRGWRCRR